MNFNVVRYFNSDDCKLIIYASVVYLSVVASKFHSVSLT